MVSTTKREQAHAAVARTRDETRRRMADAAQRWARKRAVLARAGRGVVSVVLLPLRLLWALLDAARAMLELAARWADARVRGRDSR